MRKLSTMAALATICLMLPALAAHELTLRSTSQGNLSGLDLIPALSPDSIRIEGLGLTLERLTERHERTDRGELKRTWIGVVQGIRNSRAVFTSMEGLTAGTVTLPGMGFMLLPDGRIWTSEASVSCGTDAHLEASLHLQQTDQEPKQSTGPVEITLALPFSTRASQEAGGDAVLRTMLYNQADVFQRVLDESGRPEIRFKIVGVRRLGIYNENDPNKSEFKILNDRTLGSYRRKLKADLVILTVTTLSNPRLGGLAHQFTGNPQAAYGFVVLGVLPAGLLIHEGGHLLNATHEAAFRSCAPDSSRIGVTTIMYADQLPPGCDSLRFSRFSNPDTPYNWYGTLYQTGDRRHCNACRMAIAAPVVSGFRK